MPSEQSQRRRPLLAYVLNLGSDYEKPAKGDIDYLVKLLVAMGELPEGCRLVVVSTAENQLVLSSPP